MERYFSLPANRWLSFLLLTALPAFAAQPPSVGTRAPDFTLLTPENHSVQLSKELARGPVILVVLRGYPGYQCPFCNRQVQDLIQKSPDFAERGAQVIAVYPGPPKELGVRANEFLTGKKLPANFSLVLDPGFEFTNRYGLRWEAEHETAFPSTFVIDQEGTVFFSKIVKEHGARATAAEILEALPKPKTTP